MTLVLFVLCYSTHPIPRRATFLCLLYIQHPYKSSEGSSGMSKGLRRPHPPVSAITPANSCTTVPMCRLHRVPWGSVRCAACKAWGEPGVRQGWTGSLPGTEGAIEHGPGRKTATKKKDRRCGSNRRPCGPGGVLLVIGLILPGV